MGIKQKLASSCPDLTFSKTGQTGKKIYKPEEHKKLAKKEKGDGGLQEQVDKFLDKEGLHSMRIEDEVYIAIKEHPNLGLETKKRLLKSLKNWPDNTIMIPIDDNLNVAICIESKSRDGNTTKGQRRFAKGVNVNVIRSVDELKKIITTAKSFVEMASEYNL